jgi:G3E family GTPase
MDKARSLAGWLRELSQVHTPETEEYGIGSFVFRARRPFHPERFWNLVHSDWPGLLRSKGFFWLSTRNDVVGGWSQAGGSAEHRPVGLWWAAVPKDRWPVEQEVQDYIAREWRTPYGDRRQELVFIGQDLPKIEMLAALQESLLNGREMSVEAEEWERQFSDPFPSWTEEEY